jgi:hypothetical protein
MATVTEPRSPAAPDPRIIHPLDRLRGTIRRFVLLDGLLAAALVLAGWVWVGLALDYGLFKLTAFDWVQDAPRWLRTAALVLVAGLVVAVVARRIVFRLTREFSYPALAMVLEKRYPALLGDRLITAVELADVAAAGRVGYSVPMIEETIREARERVERVPVREVFNWRRLRAGLGLVAGLLVGLVAVAYMLAGLVGGTWAPGRFAWRFADVAAIWAERTVLLKDTPWPRQAHLELVGFPDQELRIGKDAPPPKVRVRAVEWVVAAPGTRDGWRPLRWDDLTSDLLGGGVDVPHAASVRQEDDWRPADVARAGLLGGVGLPADRPVSTKTTSLDGMTADEALAAFPAETEAVARRLDELAARPGMSRTLRRLAVPGVVTLAYNGKPTDAAAGARAVGSTRGTLKLTREPNSDFSAEVAGLKESIGFTVRAEDFRTPGRDVVLVPPPMLTRLPRQESSRPTCSTRLRPTRARPRGRRSSSR